MIFSPMLLGMIYKYIVPIMAVYLTFKIPASYKPLIKAMSHADTMANIQVVIQEIKSVMDMPELERGETVQKINSYDVSFDNVNFGYRTGKKILKDLSFTAKEGQLTAIAGYSGSGKSTITKLIEGYWNVDTGKLSVFKKYFEKYEDGKTGRRY